MSKVYPGHSDIARPELFTVPPPYDGPYKPGQFDEQQLKQFFKDGFVVVENFFKPEELEPVKADIEKVVDKLVKRLHAAGKITELHEDAGLFKRLTLIEKQFPGSTILLMKYGELCQSFRNLWSNERLLNLAEQIIGTPNIAGHPVWNLRTKTPGNEATTVPWHQDVAYLDQDSYGVMQLSAWIPLLDTNENNGCMQMMRGGHRSGKVAVHKGCAGDTWYVMLGEDEMRNTLGIDLEKDLVTCPVPYGGAIFFNNLIPHQSLSNTSDDIRWTMDLRWQRADKPVGFHGLKNGIQMRSTDPDFKIDWSYMAGDDKQISGDEKEFDTVMYGPWIKSWEIVHENRHTSQLKEDTTTNYHGLGRHVVP